VDYSALPVPNDARPELEAAYAAPETGHDRAITLVWQEVLGVEKVGVYDNFFDLGGNSLLLVQLHRKLQIELRRKIPLVEMFRHPSVDAMVHYLFASARNAHAAIADNDGVASRRAGRDRLAQLAEYRQGVREAK